MRGNRELAAALAAMAAVSGAGFASGREIVLFFSQLGWAAWPGMILAAALFAVMLGVTLRLARKTGAGSFPGVFQRLLGRHCGDVIGILHGLLMAFAAAMMLKTCGELGAIVLPVENGYLLGMILALLMAIIIAAGRNRLLPLLGGCAVIAAILMYTALFLDSREVRIYARSETVLALSGSLWAAVILALLHASLNVVVAAGSAIRYVGGNFRPWRAAVLAGGMMLACLLCAHGAILRGGGELYVQALPMVILAARWGINGFWLSAGFMYFASVCTLSAALGSLVAQFGDGGRQRRAAGMMLMMAFLFSCALGVDDVIGFGYPVLGWICAFSMAALACWYDRERPVPGPFGREPANNAKND